MHGFLHRLVETLSDAVLLRRRAKRLLPLGAVLVKDGLPVLVDVLAALVIPEDADGVAVEVEDHGAEVAVGREGVVLLANDVHPGMVSEDVSEGHPVLPAGEGADRELAMEICDDEAEGASRRMGGVIREGIPMLLRVDTRLADGGKRRGRGELNSDGHVLGDELL